MGDLNTIEGVADLMAAARSDASEYMKADIREVEEPGTGIKMLVIVSGGEVRPLDRKLFDPYRDNLLRISGTAALLSLGSFVDLVNRFKDADSAVFGNDDRKAPSLTAIFNYHEPAAGDGGVALADASDIARHSDHRATFAFPLSDEWLAWMESNKQPMSMSDFALFLEDRWPDVLTITALEELPEKMRTIVEVSGGKAVVATPQKLIELSRGLKINEAAAVEESVNLASGEGSVRFTATHTGADGKAVKVPSIFIIGLPVFRNGQPYRMMARLRYRLSSGKLVFWYELARPDAVFDDAFAGALEEVRERTALPVFLGKPQA